MQHNWEAATVAMRAEHMQELDSWRGHLPTAMGENLVTCASADLLVYMQSHWLPNHASTMLPDGSMIASASGVSGCPVIPVYRLPAQLQSCELGCLK